MLTIVEARVVGCLLEKERSVPDQYPLTLNALVSACNQSTSREPVMHLSEHEIEATLAALKVQGLVRYVHPAHGRSVTRYRQVADEAWGLPAPEAAVVAVLLLRGPQTTAELRTRTERLHPFATVEALETTLFELVSAGSVEALPRQPGQKEHRWRQLLAEASELPEAMPADDHTAHTAPTERPTTVRAAGPSAAERIEQLERRVARLETLLAELLPELLPDATIAD
ncbi:MAG: YceH family protein [Actinomycetota bacterium]|nr:YceH family protein [Actinomycetota bacterium]